MVIIISYTLILELCVYRKHFVFLVFVTPTAEDGNTVNVAAAVVVPIVVLIIIAVVVIAIFVPIGCWKRKQYKEKLVSESV